MKTRIASFALSLAVTAGVLTSLGATAQSFRNGYAAAISQVLVMQVQSATGGAEDVENRPSTSRHHAGTFVYVTTVERGMGRTTATMNGGQLRELKTVNVCESRPQNWVACANGQTVQGRLRVWNATGKGNGTFSVRSTSVNFPHNTITSTLSLR